MKRSLVLSLFLVLFVPLLAAPAKAEKEQALIQHVKTCIENAERGESKIDAKVLSIHGMSSPKVRHFLNNLCTLPQCTYLEVGCWKGSTLVAALYRNDSSVKAAAAIENWCEFGSPRQDCFDNIARCIPNSALQMIEQNCFSVNPYQIFKTKVTIYFYDGAHDFVSQERAFSHFNPAFDDVFIAIVDDWNWGEVRDGTRTAFSNLHYTILYERELMTSGNGDMSSWWNGLYVAVIRKES